MKRANLIFKHCASRIHLPKLAFCFAILMALNLSALPTVDAQRHGGSGRGMGTSGGSHMSHISGGTHMSRSFGRMNKSRIYTGNFVPRNHYGGRYYRYWGAPGWGYSFWPFWGDYYWGIPPYALRFYIDGSNYYDSDGIYFKQENDKYKVVPAPLGLKVKTLPKGSQEFTVDGNHYFYYFGTYYAPRDGKYEVVEPPIGAEVDSIPDGYDKVMIDGQTYFSLNGVQYKAVLRDNVIWYQVIKNNSNKPVPSNPPSKEVPM